jgi:hypothetical protein
MTKGGYNGARSTCTPSPPTNRSRKADLPRGLILIRPLNSSPFGQHSAPGSVSCSRSLGTPTLPTTEAPKALSRPGSTLRVAPHEPPTYAYPPYSHWPGGNCSHPGDSFMANSLGTPPVGTRNGQKSRSARFRYANPPYNVDLDPLARKPPRYAKVGYNRSKPLKMGIWYANPRYNRGSRALPGGTEYACREYSTPLLYAMGGDHVRRPGVQRRPGSPMESTFRGPSRLSSLTKRINSRETCS